MSLAVSRPHLGQTSRSGACARGRRTTVGGWSVFGTALARLRTGIDTSILLAVIATDDGDLFTEEFCRRKESGRRNLGSSRRVRGDHFVDGPGRIGGPGIGGLIELSRELLRLVDPRQRHGQSLYVLIASERLQPVAGTPQ